MTLLPSTGVPAVAPFGMFAPRCPQWFAYAIGQRLPNAWTGRRLARWLRAGVQILSRQPVDVIRLGSRMRLHVADNAFERRLLITPHFVDPAELAVLKGAICPAFTFVDLGANIGTYSLFVARHGGPDARILAVEPVPEMVARLTTNIALNAYTTITVHPCAVADGLERSVTLNLDSTNIGASSLLGLERVRGDRVSISVQARPLTALIAEQGFSRIDALKADLEGAEDQALLPFLRTAPEDLWPRLVILEDNDRRWREDLLGHLLRHGWRRARVAARNLVLVRTRERTRSISGGA